jgi:hypothetical protein
MEKITELLSSQQGGKKPDNLSATFWRELKPGKTWFSRWRKTRRDLCH